MAILHRCFNSPSNQTMTILDCYSDTLVIDNNMATMRTKFFSNADTSGGVKTMWTYTASQDCTVIFPSWSCHITNITNGEGYLLVTVNNTQIYKEYLTNSSLQNANLPAQISLTSGDVLSFTFGFDGSHTNVRYGLHTYPIIVTES